MVAAGAAAAPTITPPPSGTPPAKESAAGERATNGRRVYRAFCASCHGEAGHGDGPVAKDYKISPPDLSRLAARNQGRFPRKHIYEVLDARQMARGQRTALFQTPGTEAEVREWILELISYLESIQATPGRK